MTQWGVQVSSTDRPTGVVPCFDQHEAVLLRDGLAPMVSAAAVVRRDMSEWAAP